ncbi:bifunctional transcriptional regulator/O6-methylguanine-DNA methyltransferase [Thioalkalivibrio denitrificans]|uniref:Bifunctional transcriptional regulator/O6-methylguanine-DNA methyltransferase n=1 Tax=Thioalkalivibrio denitrificans TaxID=108003 RepID=A0A1V3NSF9_9GAMM|nr:bifunctional DNA-binding transcriptional regulator/O6-methylguanine-DNA methyltransferase Ada [Thioalkalivibrio denitrificans]OOG27808.1 bifunctional transcriptional regulator/O6-methylguanine-DNA methyltransferase [Thioalkalivibrio denitrificans]
MADAHKTRAAKVIQDPRWAALAARDRAADGRFVYSVRTTGVYCRPSCPSRLARPENVDFHASPDDAERAGFRPCRRCRPDRASQDDAHVETVAALCRYIEDSDHVPTLDELSRRSGFSPWHLHRIFKAVTGLTPRAYGVAHRAQRLRSALEEGGSVTRAIHEAGYGSSARGYAESGGALGMTPGRYGAGGARTRIRFAVGACTLGHVLVASTEKGICFIAMGDDPDALVRDLQDRFPRAELVGGDPAFERQVGTVLAFIEAPGTGLDLPLDIRGTVFQRRVWHALRQIPAGETVSYAELARRIGAPGAARAVARACASNPIAVVIPCHRVVRQDGSLSGYRWGVARKRALLEREEQAQ